MNEVFNKILQQFHITNPDGIKGKRKSLLNTLGGWGGLYVNKINEKLPPLKNPCLIKEKQAKEDIIKANMRKANNH